MNPQLGVFPNLLARPTSIPVWYTGSDAVIPGQPVCYDHDSTDSTARPLGSTGLSTTDKQVGHRGILVERPTFGNLITDDAFAGIVAPETTLPAAIPSSGGYQIYVYPRAAMWGQIDVYTDENITRGDLLGPLPSVSNVGRGVVYPCFRAVESVDRSGTAGIVRCQYNPNWSWDKLPQDKVFRFFDHFDGKLPYVLGGFTPAEVLIAGYEVTGATAAAAYTSDVGGRLVITPTTTTIIQIHPGAACFPFVLSTGKSVWFRANVNFGVGAVDNDVFLGLAITGAAISDGTVPPLDDYLGFYMQGDSSALINIATNRDNGTDNVTSTGTSQVADTMHDLAFLVRNRVAGDAASATEVKVFVDGVLTNTLNSAAVNALINKDEAMRMVFAGIGGAAAVAIEIDRWEGVINL